MSSKSFVFILLLLTAFYASAQSENNDFVCGTKMKDCDGNEYNTVRIGNQCWMKENIRSTHTADGTDIPEGNVNSTTTAYRYLPNKDTNNVITYGYLYNHPAALKLCPTGWHLPSKAEFEELITYCGAQFAVGGNRHYTAKALAAQTGWRAWRSEYTVGDNPQSNNASGFSGMSAGYCHGDEYRYFGEYAYFWSTTLDSYSDAYYLNFGYSYKEAGMYTNRRYCGVSVRCLHD